jgi:hypothetical protein
MSIYDSIGSGTALTLAQKQWATLQDLRQLVANNYNELLAIYIKGFAFLNDNKLGLTKEEVIMGMGMPDWEKFYVDAVILKTLLNHCKPGTIVDPVQEIDLAQSVFTPPPVAPEA